MASGEPLGVEIFKLAAVLEFIGLIVASVFIQLAPPMTFADTMGSVLTPLAPGSNATALAPAVPAPESSPFDPLWFVRQFADKHSGQHSPAYIAVT